MNQCLIASTQTKGEDEWGNCLGGNGGERYFFLGNSTSLKMKTLIILFRCGTYMGLGERKCFETDRLEREAMAGWAEDCISQGG